MIQSMTGYGKANCMANGRAVTIEIKSLNSKQLDLSIRVPSIFRELEMDIRNEIQQLLLRGKVEVNVSFDNNNKDTIQQLNHEAIASYVTQLQQAAATLGIKPPEDIWSVVLRLPDVLRSEQPEVTESDLTDMKAAVREAIKALIDFRIQEGNMLKSVFEEKIARIASYLNQIEEYEPERIETIKNRIAEALEKISNNDYDKNRFEQEMIFYIEKLDINEEKKRLTNHLDYFKSTMEETVGQGKKLGFITQEIGREINTLGSKSNHTAMQQLVVCMKDELEQMKEQVLNVL